MVRKEFSDQIMLKSREFSVALTEETKMRHLRRSKDSLLARTSAAALFAATMTIAVPAFADDATIQKWIDSEFQPSTLSKADQLKELQWFEKAAAPFKGMEINVVSETIATHEYESKTLAKAFSEITGIKLKHDLIQEGDVVEKLQTQMQSGKNVYDMYINDSDLIGTHFQQDVALDRPFADVADHNERVMGPARIGVAGAGAPLCHRPVSYTHLTLPTILRV